MHHDRTVLFTVLAHVGQIEALGQREVHLNGGALPLTADAVKKLDVDLGAVEGAIALIDIVGQVEFFHGQASSVPMLLSGRVEISILYLKPKRFIKS